MLCLPCLKLIVPELLPVMKKYLILALVVLGMNAGFSQSELFSKETALQLSKLPLECISQEFPNKTSHTSETAGDHVLLPSELHPSFYGCFDWHSSVHGHWMLIKILKIYPDISNRDAIIATLENSFQPDKIKDEAAYFSKYEVAKSFERTYGWAWTLKLDEELLTWDNPLGKKWHQNLQPLTQTIVNLWSDYLPKQTYPNRTGVHPNTAFGLGFAIDWVRAVGQKDFETALTDKAVQFYKGQKNAPAYLEPDGSDFFSPSLLVADLMGRILDKKDFENWFKAYLSKTSLENLLQPPVVSDRQDYQIVHLDGLSLSRAWCLKGIARDLPANSKLARRLNQTAEQFLVSALPEVIKSSYGGSHWLGSFAVYAIFN